MHVEICLICQGRGWICENYPAIPPCSKQIICHGCDGKGWVEVSDEYYPPYPYPWITPYTITWQTWSPYRNYHFQWTIKIECDSLNPYQLTQEGCE